MTMTPYTGQQHGNGLTVPGPYGPPMYQSSGVVQHIERPSDVDSWTTVLAATAQLAEQICNTDFVPAAMRNNPAACTAAMLTGRELGIGPMTSLAHIHIVKGKPGQSAQLMRQLVLAAGHQIRYIETTDSRCVVEGRRRGEDQWERVSFTAQQAKTARIDLGGYPEDKLVARATSRLCRRKFSDCLGGMAYTIEELEDGPVRDDTAAVAEPAPVEQPAARRTAKRSTPTKPAPTRTAPRPAQEPEPAGPPLPGEDGYDDPGPVEPATGQDNTDSDGDKPTTAQNRKMHALFRDAEVTERDDRLRLTGLILGRDIDTSTGLSRDDANTVIDHLERWASEGHLADHVAAVLHGGEE